MMTANVAQATSGLSSAKLRALEGRNPLTSLARAGVSLARLELANSLSHAGRAVSDAAYNFAHPKSLLRDSEAIRALHAA
jgi:hypothetical protein